MSLAFRRRRREAFKRAGGASESAPNRRLPRAQERVQQAIESASLSVAPGGWGRAPIKAFQSYSPGERRSGIPPVRPGSRSPLQAGFKALAKLQFKAPARTLVCHQRSVRREVLFARRVAGFKRSPGRGGSYHRRPESQYGC